MSLLTFESDKVVVA